MQILKSFRKIRFGFGHFRNAKLSFSVSGVFYLVVQILVQHSAILKRLLSFRLHQFLASRNIRIQLPLLAINLFLEFCNDFFHAFFHDVDFEVHFLH